MESTSTPSLTLIEKTGGIAVKTIAILVAAMFAATPVTAHAAQVAPRAPGQAHPHMFTCTPIQGIELNGQSAVILNYNSTSDVTISIVPSDGTVWVNYDSFKMTHDNNTGFYSWEYTYTVDSADHVKHSMIGVSLAHWGNNNSIVYTPFTYEAFIENKAYGCIPKKIQ